MNRRTIRHAAASVATAALMCGGGSALAVGLLDANAEAVTAPCAGDYTGFCGGQVLTASPYANNTSTWAPLEFDARGQSAKAGTPIVAWPASTADRATDFFTAPAAQYSGYKTFEYAPGARRSGMCLSIPSVDTTTGTGAVVEEPCNGGPWQAFRAVPVAVGGTGAQAGHTGYLWVNRATGLAITDHGGNSAGYGYRGTALVGAAPQASSWTSQAWSWTQQ